MIKKMKKLLLVTLVFIAQCVAAQDVIITKQSERIDAKIIKVSESEIEYKRQNNLDGPTFTLSTSKIASILYQNGDVQTFETTESPHSTPSYNYKSGFSAGFSMPVLRGEYSDYLGDYSEKLILLGFYLGYSGKLLINEHLSFCHNMLINFAWNEGDMKGHMIDFRMPMLFELGTPLNGAYDTVEVYACAGPQILVGLSMGRGSVEYSDGLERFDVGLAFGGGIRLSKSVQMEILYTFGLIDRNSSRYAKEKFNFLTAGFNFYL